MALENKIVAIGSALAIWRYFYNYILCYNKTTLTSKLKK